jgi:DNA (cytosine-5)-methyltransferase 1
VKAGCSAGSVHAVSPALAKRAGIIELFAGIGGVAQGFERSGSFETIALTDCDKAARGTFLENFPNAKYLRRSVQWLKPSVLLDAADGRPIAGLVGCPPCQGFSSAGARDAADPRNGLLAHYFRLLQALQPAFFVMENVPRVLDFDVLQRSLERADTKYRTWKGTLNAALFGLPQTRHRAIVIGYRRDLEVEPMPPLPTHFGKRPVFDYRSKKMRKPTAASAEALLGMSPDVVEQRRRSAPGDDFPVRGEDLADLLVVRDAIGDLPPAAADDKPQPYAGKASGYATALRSTEVGNHRGWRHRKEMLDRLAKVPEGGGLLDEHGRSLDRPYFSQAYARLHRRGLARTITTNFHNPGSGRFLHYRHLRTLTVREAARLQGFPDSFAFIGFQSTQERLIGNAFPIPLAEGIATQIGAQLGISFRGS